MTQRLRNSFSVTAHLLTNTQNILNQLTLTQHHTLINHNPINIITSELNNVSQHFQHNKLNGWVIMFSSDVQDKSSQLSISLHPLWATEINHVNNQIYIRSLVLYIRTVQHSEFWPSSCPAPVWTFTWGETLPSHTHWLTDPHSPDQPVREIYGRPSPRRSTGTISLSFFLSLYGFITFCH